MVPTNVVARVGNLLVPQGGAVHVVGAFLVGRAFADDGFAADHGWLVGHRLGGFNRSLQGFGIVAINTGNHMPAVGFKPLRRVIGEPAFNVAVDRDAVVVPERNQLAQTPGTGQRTGFVRNTFHQATVAEEYISVVIDDFVAGLVEFGRQQLFSHRHADGVGDALAKGTGGGLHARRIAVFRVTRRFRMQLAEALELVHRQVVAGQMQQRIQQHRAVAVGQHKAVAVKPFRVGRVMAQVMVPHDFGDFRHAHRRARVAGLGFFHCIHGQRPDRVCEIVTSCHCFFLHEIEFGYMPQKRALGQLPCSPE